VLRVFVRGSAFRRVPKDFEGFRGPSLLLVAPGTPRGDARLEGLCLWHGSELNASCIPTEKNLHYPASVQPVLLPITQSHAPAKASCQARFPNQRLLERCTLPSYLERFK
jgi:hypothetical protein